MRATIAEVEELRSRLAPLDTEERRARYLARDFPRSGLVRDLDKRYRWDLYHLSGARHWELDDAHIYTMLRRIVPKLEG